MSSDDQADLRAYLETATPSTVAWLANYLTRKRRGSCWPNRQAAIEAILKAECSLEDSNPRRGVVQRLLLPAPVSALGGMLEVPGG